MNNIFVMLVIFYYYTTNLGASLKFELVLENMTDCDKPQPPFSRKKKVLLEYKLTKSKGKCLISGRNTVLAEVPFRNFSLSGYNIDKSGKQERWLHVGNISCRNFFGRTFLVFGLFQYNKDNCVLQRSSISFKDMDLDRMAHKLALQQGDGRTLYRVQLEAEGGTVFCVDTTVFYKPVK